MGVAKYLCLVGVASPSVSVKEVKWTRPVYSGCSLCVVGVAFVPGVACVWWVWPVGGRCVLGVACGWVRGPCVGRAGGCGLCVCLCGRCGLYMVVVACVCVCVACGWWVWPVWCMVLTQLCTV